MNFLREFDNNFSEFLLNSLNNKDYKYEYNHYSDTSINKHIN
jgi:hypothetical protein